MEVNMIRYQNLLRIRVKILIYNNIILQVVYKNKITSHFYRVNNSDNRRLKCTTYKKYITMFYYIFIIYVQTFFHLLTALNTR